MTTTTQANIYTPPGATNLKDAPLAQIRLGIQGAPKTGKTFAATTFPNPIFLNFDRGLGAHRGKSHILEIPFWDTDFIKKLTPNDPSRKNALISWLKQEGSKLTTEQTLVIDGSTGIQNAFDAWYKLNPVYTRNGKEDDFAQWRLKKEFFAELCESLKLLKCHVIYIAHETVDRDKEGNLNGKVKPLLTGSFSDELASHFTDWLRALSTNKPKDFTAIKPESLANWGFKSVEEFKSLCNSYAETDSMYFWQVHPDAMCNTGTSSLINAPRFIKADFETFSKYLRK